MKSMNQMLHDVLRSKKLSFQNKQKVHGPDRIGICGFNDRGFIILQPVTPHTPALIEKSRGLHARVNGSYTNLADGLRRSAAMLAQTPPGYYRRIWLLSDGLPNREVDRIMPAAKEARRQRINVNTIGFGDSYDEKLLKAISAATHNGKFFRVSSLRQLSDALVRSGSATGPRKTHEPAEATIFCIDLSGSMVNPMGTKRKVEVVEEALLHLIHYKRRCFS